MTVSATEPASVDAADPQGDASDATPAGGLAAPAETVPSPAETDVPRRRRAHLWVLLVLTLLGGALRFAWLDRPALWGDEAMTFSRVTGTFQDFLDIHQRDAFTPLHYELYWLLGKLVLLTPFWMRLIPAVAGTLMIPAMYFLARQLTTVRTALVAAGLTATSAYMLAYSRDAKMYMAFWLCGALNVACLLWWLRTGRRVAWLAWVAAGATMLALHLTGLFVLGVQVLFVLTRRRFVRERPWYERVADVVEWPAWRRVVLGGATVWILFVAGTLLITAGAAGHFLGFSLWSEPITERVEDDSITRIQPGVWPPVNKEDLTIPGIEWIERVNTGRDGPNRLLQVTTAFLFSHEWPPPPERSNSLFAMAAAAAKPPEPPPTNPRVRTAMRVAAWGMLGLFALGALPWPARLRGAKPADPPTEPWWRAALWLSLWLLVPPYIAFCASVRSVAPPWTWPGAAAHLPWAGAIAGALLALGAIALALHWVVTDVEDPAASPLDVLRRRAARLLQLVGVVLGVLLACAAIYWLFDALGREPRDKWQPRYLGVIWPAVGIAAAALLMRLPTWPLRWLAVAFVVLVNLGQAGYRVLGDTEPRMDLLARDIRDAQDPAATTRTFIRPMPSGLGPAGGGLQNFVGKYYVSITAGKHLTPWTMRLTMAEEHAKVDYVQRAADVLRHLRAAPHVRRIVTWESVAKEHADAPSGLLAVLGPGWELVSTENFDVYEHWTWRYEQTQRRRVYERTESSSATKPIARGN